MESKCFILGRYEDVICVFDTESDAQEMLIDLLFEDQYETFNLSVNFNHSPVATALIASKHLCCYWIEKVPYMRMKGE